MIKTKNKGVMFKGNLGQLANEYRLITEGMVGVFEKAGFKKEDAIEQVKELQRHGFMTEEEIIKEAKDKIGELLGKILENLNSKEEESND